MNENLPKDEEKDVKLQTLIANTAQGIFNYLKEIENKREIFEKRWIWELLQNALDAAAQDQKIEVEITKNDDQLTFTHDGRPFKLEEVAHLIYHGSTKREQDIGKFGTGFLVTHLLSRKVNVKGIREDREKFDFLLDRNGTSPDEIKKLMEDTWEKYQKSLVIIEENLHCTAEYVYPLSDISLKTVEEGIEALTRIAPYVLAFNDKLGVIKITDQTRKLKFELVNESNSRGYIKTVVKEEEEGKPPILHELWVVKDDEVEIAIKGKKYGNKTCQIESLQGIPKIFIAFPLFGTQDLPFPVVVNSRKFEPTEKRDGIFLGREDTDDIKQNKGLLEKANNLFINLVSNSDSNRWENIHTLLKIERPPEKDWLDKDWYTGLLKNCIGEIRKLRLLKTESGSFIAPDDGFIPIVEGLDEGKIEGLWNLCYCFLDYNDKIPANELVFEWAQVINGWSSIGLDLAKIKITIEELTKKIEGCGNLQGFKSNLNQDKDEFETLNDFYKLLLDLEKSGLFDGRSILPDQNGDFKRKPKLFKDEGIDETLKDISNKLGIDVRNQLLHSNVYENVQSLLQAKKQEDVLNHLVSEIKHPLPEDKQYLQANIESFKWLVEHDKLEYLEGYPLLSLKEKIFTLLGKENKEKLLAPKDLWSETAKIHIDLFPLDLIISSYYFEKVSEKDKWDKLANEGLILINPVYKVEEKLSREDLDCLLLSDEKLEEEKEHELTDNVVVSKIAFLETKDKGVIDTIRKSKDKSRNFLDFLFRYVIEEDIQWDSLLEVSCTCGKMHKIYPALWLVSLKNRSWVPVRKDKSEKPNAQFLAPIIETDEKLVQKCKQDKPASLLRKLNINLSELMMHVAAKDDAIRIELDKAMGSLFSTFMENPNQLSKIAKLAENEPELFIKEMEDRIQTREQIRRNQSIGSLVETLLKNVLEKEGFKVDRTGVGSDFVVEHDFVEDDVETILEIKKENATCSYIEVKATTLDFVRMTLTQAKEARGKSDKYALCVIKLNGLEPNEENIKNSAKFVTDIGKKIQDKVSEAENLEDEQEKIAGSGDIEIEISEDPIRFKINERIWEESKTLDQFITLLRGL